MSKAMEIFRDITSRAMAYSDQGRELEGLCARGESIPDRLLPGRFLIRLTAEERAELSTLKADETRKQRLWW